jgi:response regulator RpfG family c-di-GMP phosphodiesterase
MDQAQSGTLEALAMALDYRDQSTSGHSRRVANLTVNVARAYGVDGSALQSVEQGALLHDIGKLKIPDSILWKPSQLDDTEWVTMRVAPREI